MNTILNLNSNELNKFIDDDVLVICINYTIDEFNKIKSENYLNTEQYKFGSLKNITKLFLILNLKKKM